MIIDLSRAPEHTVSMLICCLLSPQNPSSNIYCFSHYISFDGTVALRCKPRLQRSDNCEQPSASPSINRPPASPDTRPSIARMESSLTTPSDSPKSSSSKILSTPPRHSIRPVQVLNFNPWTASDCSPVLRGQIILHPMAAPPSPLAL
jgi:hypothetical protein